MSIKILPEHVANQIAAGEVVEGPSSVVKELVENSIDAGASKINIEIKNSNRSIKVTDNGSGMSSEDLDLAFKRHATSKIFTIDDLENLVTNGFRGEALASIAAVSKLTCVSKRDTDDHASKIYLENGAETKGLTGASTGTSIHADELFFNTPARLKFLKATTKERDNIIDIVRSLALAHAEISFNLKIDNKDILSTSGSNQITKVIEEIFSKDVAKELNEIKFHTGDLELYGYCSNPYMNRSDRRGIFTLLNNRAIKCHIMRSALEAAYKDLIPKGKYPFAVLFLKIPFDTVDVNVHPTKKEVKYKNTNKIYTAVGDSVAKALSESFYKRNQNYQTSLRDLELKVTEQQALGIDHDKTSHNDAFTIQAARNEKSNQFEKNSNEENQKITLSKKFIAEEKNQNPQAYQSLKDKFHGENPDTNKFSYATDCDDENSQSEKLESESRKFVSRLGSVDVSILNSSGLKTVISQQGNKTNYEIVANDTDSSLSVLLRGNFIGENWIKEKYLSFLNELAEDILEEELEKSSNLNTQKPSNRSRPRKKPSQKILDNVWARDNYTCVYCSKPLLHPDMVKTALEEAVSEHKTHLNKNNKEVTLNLINEHLATYDHHLPASKFGELNTTEENLYASCLACNKEKSDSLSHRTWSPSTSNAWEKINEKNPIKIAGRLFSSPN